MSHYVTSSELLMLQQEGTAGENKWSPAPSAQLMLHKLALIFASNIPPHTKPDRDIKLTGELLNSSATSADLRK